ncbi:MAG: response regulator [Proteobacteria bacterium]|nr:response regulator [Pseudomonadota bacterium]
MGERHKILVVEDDALIAMEMGERLEDLGYAPLEPARTIEAAEALLRKERPAAALLDANLAGSSSIPLGAKLAAMGVPVAFYTGYDVIKNLPPELAKAPVLTKPVSDDALSAALKAMLP